MLVDVTLYMQEQVQRPIEHGKRDDGA